VTDTEFARAFEQLAIPPEDFNHRGHLRLAWVYLTESPSTAAATSKMAEAVKRFAVSVGKPGKYSDAVTEFWMQQLAAVRNAMPGASFSDLLEAYPSLLDSRLGMPAQRQV
jgi:hypothetical protein